MAIAAACILWFAVIMYSVLGGADYGAGFWDLFAGGSRKGERPRSHLEGFSGYLHADAFAGYEALYRAGGQKPEPDGERGLLQVVADRPRAIDGQCAFARSKDRQSTQAGNVGQRWGESRARTIR